MWKLDQIVYMNSLLFSSNTCPLKNVCFSGNKSESMKNTFLVTITVGQSLLQFFPRLIFKVVDPRKLDLRQK